MSEQATIAPVRKFGAALESLSPGLRDAINRIPAHDANTPPSIDERRDASEFVSPERWAVEKARVFRRMPVPLVPSASIPEKGSVMAHDGYGVPVLITRDRQGEVHVFLNACTHKGAELTKECTAHKTSALSCPFHAWTFALDGRLIGVRRMETLSNFNKSERPLTRLPSLEVGGLVWAILNPEAKADFSALSKELTEDFISLGLPTAHVYGQRRFHMNCNWKLLMEPFMEGYHVARLHNKSIGPQGANMFADVVGVSDVFGLHIRQTSGRGNFTPEVVREPGINVRNYVVHAFNLFPNAVVVTSPYYTSVMILMPQSENKTEIDYYMLTEGAPDNPKAEDLYARSFAIIQDVFGNEDFAASETCHAGLASGALKDVIYTGMEVNIPTFYKGLDRVIAQD